MESEWNNWKKNIQSTSLLVYFESWLSFPTFSESHDVFGMKVTPESYNLISG